jgi:hypothetical protein
MTTTIDNSLRVYQVTTSTGKQVFCNITELNQVIKELNAHAGYFKINHFWNNRAQRVTKKDLKSFFEGAEIKQDFYY